MEEQKLRKIIREETIKEMSRAELENKLQRLEYYIGTEIVRDMRKVIPFEELSPDQYLKIIRAIQLIIKALS